MVTLSGFAVGFFAVFTTSLESQAIKAPEGARALFMLLPRSGVLAAALPGARLRLG